MAEVGEDAPRRHGLEERAGNLVAQEEAAGATGDFVERLAEGDAVLVVGEAGRTEGAREQAVVRIRHNEEGVAHRLRPRRGRESEAREAVAKEIVELERDRGEAIPNAASGGEALLERAEG